MSAPYFHGNVMTKREVLIAREAFRRGRRDYCLAPHEVYPLPKVTRPRVVRDPLTEREYRVLDGQMQTRMAENFDGEWRCMERGSEAPINESGAGLRITPERVALWADLLANPTEEVEE